MEGDQCSRCVIGSLTVDEQEGFLLCPNCGFVADEVHLVNNPLGGEGVTVGDHVAGGGAAFMSGGGTSGFRRGVGAAPSTSSGHDRGRREAVDRLKGVASRLMLPSGMVQEAVSMFHEVRDRKLLRIGSDRYTVDAQMAAVLFTVIRSQNQPMPISEVAHACQASPLVVGRHFRTLASALHMPALFPSATIRAFAMRLAAKLLETLNCDQGPRVQHPFFLEAVAVTELVAKLGVGEGRPPVILAAATLLWVAELGVSKKHLPSKSPFAQVLSAAAGCNIASVQSARKLVAQKVLQIALLLPMSAHFTEANLLHYFPLVSSLVHTLAKLKRTGASTGVSTHTNTSAARIGAGGGDPSMHPSTEGATPVACMDGSPALPVLGVLVPSSVPSTVACSASVGGATDTRAVLPPPPATDRRAIVPPPQAAKTRATLPPSLATDTRATLIPPPADTRATLLPAPAADNLPPQAVHTRATLSPYPADTRATSLPPSTDTRATLLPPPAAAEAAPHSTLRVVSAPGTVDSGKTKDTLPAAEAALHRTLGAVPTHGTAHSGTPQDTLIDTIHIAAAAPRVQRSTRAKRRRGGSWGESWRAAYLSNQGVDGSMGLQQQQQQQQLQQLLEESNRKELNGERNGGRQELSQISLNGGSGLQRNGAVAEVGSKRQRGSQNPQGTVAGGEEEPGGRLATAGMKKEEAGIGAVGEKGQIKDGWEGAKQRRSRRARKTPHWMLDGDVCCAYEGPA